MFDPPGHPEPDTRSPLHGPPGSGARDETGEATIGESPGTGAGSSPHSLGQHCSETLAFELRTVSDASDSAGADPSAVVPTEETTLGPEALAETIAGFDPERGPARKRPSQTIPGYEILGELGRGGMGVVYRARQLKLLRQCALKMILGGAHANPVAAARFHSEASAIARLQHPNIVQIYHIGEADGLPFFELEFLPGGSLEKSLDGTPWAPNRAVRLMEQLTRGAAEAHRLGIVHRDLKPGNILLAADGTPKITDFGLAKAMDSEMGLTQSETILGSPSYMPPEQAEGRTKEAGPTADVYAMGAILYELVTGRPPFRGTTMLETLDQVKKVEPVPPTRLVPGLPRDLETICLKCLQKEPHKRYQTAEDLALDLTRFLKNEPIQARPIGSGERLARWCRRNPRIAALLGTVAGLLVVMAFGSTAAAVRIGREKAEADRQRVLAEANAVAEKQAREDADRNANIATHHAEEARKAQEEAGQQAQLALGTIYDVVTTADEKLRTKAEMGPLRKELLEIALRRLDQISRNAATSNSADRTMGVALQRMGTFYEQMGMTDQAVNVYGRSLDIFKRLMKEQPEEDLNTYDASISCDHLGEIGREIEPDPGKLFAYYGDAMKYRKALIEAQHTSELSAYERKRALIVSYMKLAALAAEVGDPRLGREYAGQALAYSEAIGAENPAQEEFRREIIAGSHFALGRNALHCGELARGRESLNQCLKLREEWVKTEPLSAYAKQELGRAYLALGDLEQESGHDAPALEAYRKAHSIIQSLHDKDPDNPEVRWHLANTDYPLGNILRRLGDTTAAEKHEQECLKAREYLLKTDSKNMQRKIELMLILALLGRCEEAAQMAREVSEYAPRHPGKLFAAASALSACLPSLARDPSLKHDQAEKAFATLRQAIANGFRDPWALRTAPELEPLRTLDDYPRVMDELNGKLESARPEPPSSTVPKASSTGK